MHWRGPERISRNPEKSEPATAVSWEEHQREIAAKRAALSTPLSLQAGYCGEPIDPEAALNREPWTRE